MWDVFSARNGWAKRKTVLDKTGVLCYTLSAREVGLENVSDESGDQVKKYI